VEEDVEDDFLPDNFRPQAGVESWLNFAFAGILLGLLFYTHASARVMWLVFPAFFVFLSLEQPGVIRKTWPGLALMLIIGLFLALPLFRSFARNPELHFWPLSGALQDALQQGDGNAVRESFRAALGFFTVRGDGLWRYNIPSNPVLKPGLSLLFYLGVSVAFMSLVYPYRPARRGRRSYQDSFRITSTNIFMLLTLAAGVVPVVMQGLDGSMVSALGALPAVYYFPALAVLHIAGWARRQVGPRGITALWTAYGVVLLVVAAVTAHTYFTIWGKHPAVQDYYQPPKIEQHVAQWERDGRENTRFP
jgi:hypothetical protein